MHSEAAELLMWLDTVGNLAHSHPVCPPGLPTSLLSSGKALKPPSRHIHGQSESVLFQSHVSPGAPGAAAAMVFQPHDVGGP